MEATAIDERATILRMIDDHKITADEGAKLLAAIGRIPEPKPATQPTTSEGQGRLFHVLVKDIASGRTKTKVTIPLGLVRWGLKVGARYSHEAEGVDMEELSDLIASGTVGQIIEVVDEEDGEHVQIYVE